MKRFFGLFLLTFLFVSTSNAALLIEPVVGYNLGTKVDFEGGKSYSGGSGPAYGGRLGYQKMGFQVGLDYLHSSIDMDTKDLKKNVNSDEWAAFVGFEFPVLFRVYGGYIFSANAESEARDGSDVDMKGGTGFKAGLGFTLLPFLDINFEYRRGTYDEYKTGGMKFDKDIDYNTYMLGLSLPFTI